MPSQAICDSWASAIRLLRKSIPADQRKLEALQETLNILIEEGITGDALDKVQAAVADAQQTVANDQAQLEAFTEEYAAIGCIGTP